MRYFQPFIVFVQCASFFITIFAVVTIFAQVAEIQRLIPPHQLEHRPVPYRLWKVPATGGQPELIPTRPNYLCGAPDWSPDGKFIAYDTWPVGKTFSDAEIAVVRADGTNWKIIGKGAMPSWSPDGTQIVCHTYDNPQTIVVMNADGSGREMIINHWGSPRWSPRGNRIASLGTDRQIYLHDLTTGKEQSILPKKYNGNFHYASELGFGISADGGRFAFGYDDEGLFVATLNEATMQCGLSWLQRKGIVRFCSWSPDGKRIAFSSKNGADNPEQIYIYDLETPFVAPLPGLNPNYNNACPDWSPDGKTIVFVSQSPLPKSESEQ